VPALRTAIAALWVAFWLYWLISATRAKQGTRTRRIRPPGLMIVVLVFLLFRVVRPSSGVVHSPILEVLGTILLLAGLGLAVWARIHLGRNWGMPMTQKEEPELVTSGPYRLVRHPIYSGLLLALVGTALATDLFLLVVVVAMGAYFIYSARVEERLMTASFPSTYPTYRAQSKMLIPFVL
jgi:protein-S-isoprenylcysteine O-methyltransferase Ste14